MNMLVLKTLSVFLFSSLYLFLFTSVLQAQTKKTDSTTTATIHDALTNVNLENFLNSVLAIVVSLAFLVFAYNVYKFMKSDGGLELKAAKNLMLWSVVGVFLIFSIYGFIRLIRSILYF